jgi:hypothetical protein
MPGTGHLVEPPGIAGQRSSNLRRGHRHAHTLPWPSTERHTPGEQAPAGSGCVRHAASQAAGFTAAPIATTTVSDEA